MNAEWIEYQLKDVGEIIGGATPYTKDNSNYDGDIPWITPKDLSNHKYRRVFSGSRNITEKGLRSCSTKIMPKDTVLMSSRAPIGYVAIAGTDLCTNQGFKSIVPNRNIVDPLFLYYCVLYNIENIKRLGTGTTFPEISGEVLEKYRVKLPNIEKQKTISRILSSLDDKIEDNLEINDYLVA